MVGDSYTQTGSATGSGRDHLHGLWGPDTIYGDDYATVAQGTSSGGARDTLNGAMGDDHLIGGPRHDVCAGGPGRDGDALCEYKIGVEFPLHVF